VLASSITEIDQERDVAIPFVFEVGDTNVVRGLNEAILTMKEGSTGLLTIPPHMGYTNKRTEPRISSDTGQKMLDTFLKDQSRPPVLVMELQLLRVLALPPQDLFGGNDGRDPASLRGRLIIGEKGEFSVGNPAR